MLKGVLKGAKKTQRRHRHQAATIQAAIHKERGKLLNPHDWKMSDLRWVLEVFLASKATDTRYYYWLTIQLIVRALGKDKDWLPLLEGPWCPAPQTVRRRQARKAT